MKQLVPLDAIKDVDPSHLSYDIPEAMRKAIVDDGDYNIMRFLDDDAVQSLHEKVLNMMFDCFESEVDLVDVEGFRGVSHLNVKGDPTFVEAVEALAYVIGAAFALGTHVQDGKLVSHAVEKVDLSALTPEQRELTVALAEQVFGDSFKELCSKDTTSDASLKGAIDAAAAVMRQRQIDDARKLIFDRGMFDE